MVSQNVSNQLIVKQAVFASSDRGQVKGYQLVGQSAGIEQRDTLELTRWAPTQLPSDASDRGIVSAWRLESGRTAVARTVYGGPEYSNRGGTQVVTLFLLLEDEQLEMFDFDAISLARTAVALGYLRLPLDLRREQLPDVVLPEHPLVRPLAQRDQHAFVRPVAGLIDEVAKLVTSAQRVAVTGLADPIDAIELLIAKLPVAQRKRFSFTTGLSPSIRRPVQAHFYRHPESVRRRALESQDVVYLSAMQRVG